MKPIIAETELAGIQAGIDEDDEEARIPIFASHSQYNAEDQSYIARGPSLKLKPEPSNVDREISLAGELLQSVETSKMKK